ncbi:hypothetical protein P9W85_24775 [Bacillus tropicus]|uniref:hypothetical protein n=1 Tax=Bacillus tropicus TaxID=2026188 RepID=UPI002DB89E7B|nr:hypothetical protein [Bacillus tropicus]MEC2554534.1 hypothetical protein [Bacillus tropicus]
MDNQITLMKIFDLEKVVVDQQMAINELACSVDALKRYISDLDKKIDLKVDKGDVLITSEQEEQLKKAQKRVERSNGDIDQTCKHEWTNIRIPGDDGIYVACPKCQSVDVKETRRLSRELIRKKEEEQNG